MTRWRVKNNYTPVWVGIGQRTAKLYGDTVFSYCYLNEGRVCAVSGAALALSTEVRFQSQ